MVTYYMDSSALFKLYLVETGSDWLRHTLMPNYEQIIVTTRLTIVEVGSALNRRVREGTVTAHNYTRLAGRFRDDCRDKYHIIAPNDTIVDIAWHLLERHPLRAYDAMHLATALYIHQQLLTTGKTSLIFLSADNRLNVAAAAEGLAVDNPNQH